MTTVKFTDKRFASPDIAAVHQPEHLMCGGEVVENTEHLWRCTRCGHTGYVQWSMASDVVPRRWQEQPITKMFPPPPNDPHEWEDYLDECFPEGFLGMLALDGPGHPIDATSTWHLCTNVRVHAEADATMAHLTIWSSGSDKSYRFPQVDRLEVVAPGIVAFHDRNRGYSRLDGHLTKAERTSVAEWRRVGSEYR